MGYTDDRGIYHPQHKEDGWSDEMNANLGVFSRGTFMAALDRLSFGKGIATGSVDGLYRNSTGLEVSTIVAGSQEHFVSFTEAVGSSYAWIDDPGGWVSTTSRPGNGNWSAIKPAGSTLFLPEGFYQWTGWAGLGGTANPDTRCQLWLAHEGEYWNDPYYLEAAVDPHVVYADADTLYLNAAYADVSYTGFADGIGPPSGAFVAGPSGAPALIAIRTFNAPADLDLREIQMTIYKIG